MHFFLAASWVSPMNLHLMFVLLSTSPRVLVMAGQSRPRCRAPKSKAPRPFASSPHLLSTTKPNHQYRIDGSWLVPHANSKPTATGHCVQLRTLCSPPHSSLGARGNATPPSYCTLQMQVHRIGEIRVWLLDFIYLLNVNVYFRINPL